LNIDAQAVQTEIIAMICDELDIEQDQIRPSALGSFAEVESALLNHRVAADMI
jgi:hypothetical protein